MQTQTWSHALCHEQPLLSASYWTASHGVEVGTDRSSPLPVRFLRLQVGELFTTWQQQQQQAGSAPAAHASDAALASNGSSGSSLLQVVLQEDEADLSELYFGSAEGPAGGSSSPEATAWRARNEAFRQQLAPLQQAQVSRTGS